MIPVVLVGFILDLFVLHLFTLVIKLLDVVFVSICG